MKKNPSPGKGKEAIPQSVRPPKTPRPPLPETPQPPETPPPNTPPVQPPLPETPQPPETLQQYLNSLFQYDHPFNQTYDAAERLQRQYVDLPPAVNPLSGRLLALLVRVMQAKQVLELGTGIGYSAHWLATALEATDGSLITVDSHPRTGQEAEHHFDRSGLRSRISFCHSDATEAVAVLQRRLSEGTLPPFDLIFMDCGKALYRPLLPALISLTRKGGLIAFDDTLIGWEPTVRPSIAAAMADFNEVLRKEPSLYTVNLPIGHGLTLCYKKP